VGEASRAESSRQIIPVQAGFLPIWVQQVSGIWVLGQSDDVIEVQRLTAGTGAAAARVLTDAFAGYPFLAQAFSGAQRSQETMRQMMFDWAIGYRVATGIPGLVALDGGRVVGTATLRTPTDPELPERFKAGWEAIKAEMHPAGIRLLEAYDEVQSRVQPEPKPNYMVAIGVAPDWQGRGVGRRLIEESISLDPLRDLMLDTHLEANVAKYLALGFELYAEAEVLGMPNWYFRRRGRAL